MSRTDEFFEAASRGGGGRITVKRGVLGLGNRRECCDCRRLSHRSGYYDGCH